MIGRGIRALLALVLLGACAERQWIYEKKGATPNRLEHDMGICRQEALDPKTFAMSPSGRVDREVFNRCMERKGYTVRRGE